MENSNQIILVIGATGNQGGAVARHLLQRGKFAVRALVRDENKPASQALNQAGAEPVEGDLNDRASLDQALAGVSGVFSVQGLGEGLEVEILQGNTVADAAKAAGVKHFIYSRWAARNAKPVSLISTASFKSKNTFAPPICRTQFCDRFSFFTITTGCAR